MMSEGIPLTDTPNLEGRSAGQGNDAALPFQIGFAKYSRDANPQVEYRFSDEGKISKEASDWVLGFTRRLELAESSNTFAILEESWRSLEGLFEAMEEVVTPETRSPQYWSTLDRVRRLLALLSNFLSASRMYIDSSSAIISHEFGKSSIEFAAFKEATRSAYDSSVGYRVCYALRNVLIHTGNIPASIQFQADGEAAVNVLLLADRAEFLASYDWSPSLKKTIEAHPESFDLIPLLRENWSSLVEIEHDRSRRQFEKLVDDIPKLRRILIQSGYKEAEIPLIMQVTPQSDSEIRIAHRVIPDFSVLNAVELAHREGDVLEAIWALSSLRQDVKETPSLNPAANARIEEASRLMLTWFAIGPTEATQQVRRTIQRGPSDALRISIGLVDFAGMMALMVHHLSGIPLSELFKASKEGQGDSSTSVEK